MTNKQENDDNIDNVPTSLQDFLKIVNDKVTTEDTTEEQNDLGPFEGIGFDSSKLPNPKFPMPKR